MSTNDVLFDDENAQPDTLPCVVAKLNRVATLTPPLGRSPLQVRR